MSTEITQFSVMKILFEVDTFEVLESLEKETEKALGNNYTSWRPKERTSWLGPIFKEGNGI